MIPGCFIFVVIIVIVKSAKILVVVPTPVISHQVVFRPLIHELINRNHEVVVITTDPVYPQGESPNNLKEVNLHNLSYTLWVKTFGEMVKNKQSSLSTIKNGLRFLTEVFKIQLQDVSVQKLLRDTTVKFDLLILENFAPSTLIFSHFFEAPVISMSTFGAISSNMKMIGSETHPLLYPITWQKKIYNLTVWEKVWALYTDTAYMNINEKQEPQDDKFFKGLFGSDTAALNDLKINVHMLFLNVHTIWLHNQPLPPNVVYTWGIHKPMEKMLPEELQCYLDSSKHGVIYISFGSLFDTSLIAPETLHICIKVFSQLPYDILWKWNADELPGKSENIKISKWFPQNDILRHPNLKLFITHGGLQSTAEAINAGVPLIGIPQFSDQDYNVEKYEYFKIGIKLDFKLLTTEKLANAIETILTNHNSYKKKIIQLRTLLYDQPQGPLERVMWRIEYLLRHGGVQHMRAPAANMSWVEYYELELVFIIFSGIVILGTILTVIVYNCVLYVTSRELQNLLINRYHKHLAIKNA